MTAVDFSALLKGRVPEASVARLARYAELLVEWGGTHNLVQFSDPRDLVERHLVESARYAPRWKDRGILVDIGSGGGLPGIPVLCVSPGWTGLLVEPRQKRWAFLRRVVRELEVDAEVVRERFQDLRFANPPDLITARALGGWEELLAWARPRLSQSGRVVIWGTTDLAARLGTRPDWRVLSSALPLLTRGCIIELFPCFT